MSEVLVHYLPHPVPDMSPVEIYFDVPNRKVRALTQMGIPEYISVEGGEKIRLSHTGYEKNSEGFYVREFEGKLPLKFDCDVNSKIDIHLYYFDPYHHVDEHYSNV